MNRNKYLLLAGLFSVAVLAVALASQISTLKKQWHSTMRIVPGESKTRGDAGNGFSQNADRHQGRATVLVKFRAGISERVTALAAAAHSQFSAGELRAWLLASVDNLPGLRGRVSTGGRINAARAVTGRR